MTALDCVVARAAAHIRSGYVKLLGVIFLWRSFLLVRRDAALGRALVCGLDLRGLAMCCMKRRRAKTVT